MYRFTRILSIALCLCLLIGVLGACQSGNSQQQNTTTISSKQTENNSNPDTQDLSDEPNNSAAVQGGNVDEVVIQAILDSYSTKKFAAGEVNDDDLQLILQSGAKAPSARNKQPWHFTVITGNRVSDFVRQAADGNVLIVISGLDNAGDGMNVDYDCGLASAYLYLAAQSLGYGAHIYMGGVSDINKSHREELQIPDGYSALMLMLIGNVPDGVDAVSSATERDPLDETVTYIN